MSSDDSKSDSGKKSLTGRILSLFSRTPPPAGDKYDPIWVRSALFDDDGVFVKHGERGLRAMPTGLRRIYARLYNNMLLAEKGLKEKEPWASQIAAGIDVGSGVWLAANAQNSSAVAKLLSKVQAEGAQRAVTLGPEWEEFVKRYETDGVAGALATSASTPLAATASASFTGPATPFGAQALRTDWKDIDVMDLSTLILGLADGLEYDRFDTRKMRDVIFGRKDHPSLNEFVVVCATYIFVGNNSTRLTNKVKSKAVGDAALGILNKFGVQRTKMNSTTLTLARWAISCAPAIYALRNIYAGQGKLAGAGVITSTPVVLQDVSLSGISDRLEQGDQIEDYLIKFNRALFDHKESRTSSKTPETDRDATARKFHSVARVGASSDSLLQTWNYQLGKDMRALEAFYDACVMAHAQPLTT